MKNLTMPLIVVAALVLVVVLLVTKKDAPSTPQSGVESTPDAGRDTTLLTLKPDPTNASGPIATIIQDVLRVSIYLAIAGRWL